MSSAKFIYNLDAVSGADPGVSGLYDNFRNHVSYSNPTTSGSSGQNLSLSEIKDGLSSGFESGTNSLKENLSDNGLDPNGVDWIGYYTGSANASQPLETLSYVDAPYAQMYGMDVSTAYQEALANTAYQRKVKDLKAAGLNPVLGYSGAGAASFYGTSDAGVSSSGGVSYGSLGSAKSTNALSDKQKDTLLRNLPNAIGGIVSIVKGPAAGAATSAVGNAISNIIRYW